MFDTTLPLEAKHYFTKLMLIRFGLENSLVFILVYGSFLLTLPISHPFIWLSTGATTAFLFMRGFYILPGIILGNFLAYYIAIKNVTFAGNQALLDAIFASLLLWLSHRNEIPTLIFYRLKSFFIFFLIACSLIGLSSGFFLLNFHIWIHAPFSIGKDWCTLWLAQLNALFVFAIAVISWDFYFPQIEEQRKISRLWVSLNGLVIIVSLAIILSRSFSLLAWLFPCLLVLSLYISYQFKWCSTIASNFSSTVIFLLGALCNSPFFSTHLSQTGLALILFCITILSLFIVIEIESNNMQVPST